MLKPILMAASLLLAPETDPVEPTPEAQPTAAKASPAPQENTQAKKEPAIDIHAETPPPTSWDKSKEKTPETSSREELDENTLAQQLFQTLLALIFVCLLIYLVGRFGLARLTGLRTGAPTKTLSLNEKLSLDAKNALYVVEVKGKGKLLLGGGEQGLQMICNLDDTSAFEESMNRTHTPLVDSTPEAEVQKEHHG